MTMADFRDSSCDFNTLETYSVYDKTIAKLLNAYSCPRKRLYLSGKRSILSIDVLVSLKNVVCFMRYLTRKIKVK